MKQHIFYTFKSRVNGKMLAYLNTNQWPNEASIGLVTPGVDGNYYDSIIFMSDEATSTPEEYLGYLSHEDNIKFPVIWEDIEIIKVMV